MRLIKRLTLSVAAVSAWALWSASSNEVHVVNETGHTIRRLTVDVCGETFVFENIPPGGSVRTDIARPDHEDVAELHWEFEDGRRFEEFAGYIVWEDVGRRFKFTLRPDGMVGEIRD